MIQKLSITDIQYIVLDKHLYERILIAVNFLLDIVTNRPFVYRIVIIISSSLLVLLFNAGQITDSLVGENCFYNYKRHSNINVFFID